MTQQTFVLNSFDGIDACLLSYTGADASYPFGEGARVYKVANKMFALVGESASSGEALSVTLKGPTVQNELLARDFLAINPGYHMNKQHWITVTLDGSIEDALLEELVAESYDLVFRSLPKRVREAMDS
ncbi:MmcQ/YjbR family DNA-binding protein [Lysinibacter cavernae]|uniref:Putative DNA-binding protein (MmcQ/YjbR family) n=1 Tax=Lysinibacter cavernae TaxID=1640652 RepID=A0A7X5R1U8_9MICO|nr:MmcQ/YjbR family DNA-binding protein [Lysinibacter cavernae]NIH54150.1 putative DNA-binding protein (MmcQ/YjbR family) [Lysinibacter cavernae]